MISKKYRPIVAWFLVFLLVIGDIHALTFIASVINQNPILGLLSMVSTISANIYFYHLIKKWNY